MGALEIERGASGKRLAFKVESTRDQHSQSSEDVQMKKEADLPCHMVSPSSRPCSKPVFVRKEGSTPSSKVACFGYRNAVRFRWISITKENPPSDAATDFEDLPAEEPGFSYLRKI